MKTEKFLHLMLFFVLLTVLVAISYFTTGKIFPSNDTEYLWFYSGIVMVLFSVYFIEPYYSSPNNVVINSFALILMLLSVPVKDFGNIFWWSSGFILMFSLLLFSLSAILIENSNKSADALQNKLSSIIKDVVVVIGNGRVVFSLFFFYFLLYNFLEANISNINVLTLLIFWFIVITLNPQKTVFLIQKIILGFENKKSDAVGKLFAVQSKNMFLINIYDDKNITKFSEVVFHHSVDGREGFYIGFIFDIYVLNSKKWARVLSVKKLSEEEIKKIKRFVEKKDIIYKNTEPSISINEMIKSFVGVVIEGSTISKIRFQYSKLDDDIQEGDLLELRINNTRLFYQVFFGSTEKEKLEDKNETGLIVGEAIQLGEWQPVELSFQKFGWVPAINTPLLKTDASDIVVQDFNYPDYKLGKIPNTELPSVIDLNEAVSHHMALIGVTGSGKSYLAREIIKQIQTDTKVICIDFNKEFVTTINPAPENIISKTVEEEIAEKIDWINIELGKFSNNQDHAKLALYKNDIESAIKVEVERFLDDPESSIKVFELPDVSNSTGILDYTKYFFKVLFEVAKERQIAGNQIKTCVVLEEAHTIIPEWNFSGSSEKTSQSVVNSIGQIALQGRKYGVGFLVIAQRTANVSKTVLTQCNTVVCFQAYDETSFTFLGNYVGKDMVKTLPNLKKFHAIVAGKAFKANIPMIIDLKRG